VDEDVLIFRLHHPGPTLAHPKDEFHHVWPLASHQHIDCFVDCDESSGATDSSRTMHGDWFVRT
jgi:hypothetical protein